MKNYLSILIIGGLLSCETTTQKETVKSYPQEFKEISEGLFVEKFDSLNTDVNRFNKDNKLYKPNLKFKYTYSIHQNGEEKFVNSFCDDWELVSKTDTSALENYFEAEILEGNPMEKYMPNYNQTTVFYVYPDGYNTMTGIIENSKNVWLHPPRAGIFSLLQISAFPFVKYPIKLKDTYTWDLTSGDHYADSRFVNWQGNINTVATYLVDSKEKLNTALGTLECYKIEAETVNSIGTGKTTLYFNEEYGFVKTKFNSISGVEIHIDLAEVTKVIRQPKN